MNNMEAQTSGGFQQQGPGPPGSSTVKPVRRPGEKQRRRSAASAHLAAVAFSYAEVSLVIFKKNNPVRHFCIVISTSMLFERFILFCILCNCVTLGMSSNRQGFDQTVMGSTLNEIEYLWVAVFSVEALLKIVAMGFVLVPGTYLRDGWNVMDFLVVALGYVDIFTSGNMTALRMVRVLRPLRAITRVRGMKVLVSTLLSAIPMLIDVLFLCAMTFFLWGLVAVQLFAGVLRNRCGLPEFDGSYQLPQPDGQVALYNVSYTVSEDATGTTCSGPLASDTSWFLGLGDTPSAVTGPHGIGYACGDGSYCTQYGNPNYGMTSFDNILWAWLTIFQCITLESWTDVMYYTADAVTWWVWPFFVALVAFGSFYMLSLALAVLVVQFSDQNRSGAPAGGDERAAAAAAEAAAAEEDDGPRPESPAGGGARGGAAAVEDGAEDGRKVQRQKSSWLVKSGTTRLDDKEVATLGPVRRAAYALAVSRALTYTTMALIAANTVVLCINWYGMPESVEHATDYINYAFTIYFLVELLIKLVGFGFKTFLSDGMNVFDSLVVGVSVAEMLLDLLPFLSGDIGPLSVLRMLRLLRIFRLARNWRELYWVVGAIFRSIVSTGYLLLLTLLFMFIAALMGMQLFGYKFMFCDYVEGASPVCPPGQAVWGECPNHFHCYLPCKADQYETWVDAPGSFYNGLAYCQRFCADQTAADTAAATLAPSGSALGAATPPASNSSSSAAASAAALAAADAAGGCEYLAMVGKSQVPRAQFDSVFWGMFVVFQLLTGENWNNVMYDSMRSTTPWSAVYFVAVLLIGNYLVFNLFIAILLDNCTGTFGGAGAAEDAAAAASATGGSPQRPQVPDGEPDQDQEKPRGVGPEPPLQRWKSGGATAAAWISSGGDRRSKELQRKRKPQQDQGYEDSQDEKASLGDVSALGSLRSNLSGFSAVAALREDGGYDSREGSRSGVPSSAVVPQRGGSRGEDSGRMEPSSVTDRAAGAGRRTAEPEPVPASTAVAGHAPAAAVAAAAGAFSGPERPDVRANGLPEAPGGGSTAVEAPESAASARERWLQPVASDARKAPGSVGEGVGVREVAAVDPDSSGTVVPAEAAKALSPRAQKAPVGPLPDAAMRPLSDTAMGSLPDDAERPPTGMGPGLGQPAPRAESLRPRREVKLPGSPQEGGGEDEDGKGGASVGAVGGRQTAKAPPSSEPGMRRPASGLDLDDGAANGTSAPAGECEAEGPGSLLETPPAKGARRGKVVPLSDDPHPVSTVGPTAADTAGSDSDRSQPASVRPPGALQGQGQQQHHHHHRRHPQQPQQQPGERPLSAVSVSSADSSASSGFIARQANRGGWLGDCDSDFAGDARRPPAAVTAATAPLSTTSCSLSSTDFDGRRDGGGGAVGGAGSARAPPSFWRSLLEVRRSEPLAPFIRGRALGLFGPNSSTRWRAALLVHNTYFETVVMLLILASTVTLALDAPGLDPDSGLARGLRIADYFFTGAFTIEAVLKVVTFGLVLTGPHAYLRSGWNVLDAVIVAVGWAYVGVTVAGLDERNVQALRVLRTLRALRPLRAASRFEGLRMVVSALFAVLPAMANVALVCVLFYVVFAILAVNLFKGKLFNCVDASSGERLDPFYVMPAGVALTAEWCQAGEQTVGGVTAYFAGTNVSMPSYKISTLWINPFANFDNVGIAMLTLFEVASLELWLDIAFSAVDAVGVGLQPLWNHSPAVLIFFVFFIMICSFFVLNLFVGVTLEKFHELQQAQSASSVFMTPQQRDWVDVQKLLLRARMQLRPQRPAGPPWRVTLFRWVTSVTFANLVLAAILVNTLFMAMVHVDMSDGWQDVMSYSNAVFTVVFVLEAGLKLAAFSPSGYFRDTWNCFDFFVAAISVLSVALDFSDVRNLSFMPVLRVLRVVRVIRLIRRATGLQQLLLTLVQSLPALANVGSLMLLFFTVYAIIGMSLFGGLKPGEYLGRHANFDNFPSAMLVLIRIITGESWCGIMQDCMVTTDCVLITAPATSPASSIPLPAGTYLSPGDPRLASLDPPSAAVNQCALTPAVAVLYFPSCVLLCGFIILNLVIAIILDNMISADADEALPVSRSMVAQFVDAWANEDTAASGAIHASRLPLVLAAVEPPLGAGPRQGRAALQALIMSVDIPVREGNMVTFLETLHALAGRVAGTELPEIEEDWIIQRYLKRLPLPQPPPGDGDGDGTAGGGGGGDGGGGSTQQVRSPDFPRYTAAHFFAALYVKAAIRGFLARHEIQHRRDGLAAQGSRGQL